MAAFGRVPETFIWSDRISHNGIRVLAVLPSRIHLEEQPTVKNDDLAKFSGLSDWTVKRTVSELTALGLVKATKTGAGNRYELFLGEFPGDTYRGRDSDKVIRNPRVCAHVYVPRSADV